jgi:hypothetical protein
MFYISTQKGIIMEKILETEQDTITLLLKEYLALKEEANEVEEQAQQVRQSLLTLVKKQCQITPNINKSYTVQLGEGVIIQIHPKLKVSVVDADKVPHEFMRNVKIKTTKSYTLNAEARTDLKTLLAENFGVINILALLESDSDHVRKSLIKWADNLGLKIKPEYMINIIQQ